MFQHEFSHLQKIVPFLSFGTQKGRRLKYACRAGSNPASQRLAAIVLLAEILRTKIPEMVDAVGVAPTASKVFAIDAATGGTRTHACH